MGGIGFIKQRRWLSKTISAGLVLWALGGPAEAWAVQLPETWQAAPCFSSATPGTRCFVGRADLPATAARLEVFEDEALRVADDSALADLTERIRALAVQTAAAPLTVDYADPERGPRGARLRLELGGRRQDSTALRAYFQGRLETAGGMRGALILLENPGLEATPLIETTFLALGLGEADARLALPEFEPQFAPAETDKREWVASFSAFADSALQTVPWLPRSYWIFLGVALVVILVLFAIPRRE